MKFLSRFQIYLRLRRGTMGIDNKNYPKLHEDKAMKRDKNKNRLPLKDDTIVF